MTRALRLLLIEYWTRPVPWSGTGLKSSGLLTRGRYSRHGDVLTILIQISGHLDLGPGVRRKRAEVLVLNDVDLAVADKDILRAGFYATCRALLRVLTHLAHPGVACATHAVADFTSHSLLGCPNRKAEAENANS